MREKTQARECLRQTITDHSAKTAPLLLPKKKKKKRKERKENLVNVSNEFANVREIFSFHGIRSNRYSLSRNAKRKKKGLPVLISRHADADQIILLSLLISIIARRTPTWARKQESKTQFCGLSVGLSCVLSRTSRVRPRRRSRVRSPRRRITTSLRRSTTTIRTRTGT